MSRREPVRGPRWAAAALALLALLACATAAAHKPSDSYLTLAPHDARVAVRWDVALRDLDAELGLDVDDDGALTWREVRTRWPEIDALLLAGLSLRGDGRDCAIVRDRPGAIAHALDAHSDGTYAVLQFAADCGRPVRALEVEYRLFATVDPTHRGIARFVAGGRSTTAVLGPDAPRHVFAAGTASRLATFRQFAVEGVWHIWLGFDHVLFLLALLLPSVLARAPPGAPSPWQPVPRFATASTDVLRIVTAFTVAHSITLTLAVLGWVSLPSRVVESAMAATVVLSALNNIYPVLRERRWVAAFGFGLIHGFGFAGALADLGLPKDALALALAGFNVGVELGQLAIVAVFVPAVFAIRTTSFYRRGVVAVGSWLVAAVAAAWFVERAWDVTLWAR